MQDCGCWSDPSDLERASALECWHRWSSSAAVDRAADGSSGPSPPRRPGKAAGQQTFPAPSEKGWALSATVSERVRLIVSELVTNAVVHTHGNLQLRLALLDRQVRADVHHQTPHCDFPRSGPQSEGLPAYLARLPAPPEAPSRPAGRYGAALPPGGRGWSPGWPGLAAAAHELGTPRRLERRRRA